jgi:hypothetical protein
MVDVVLFAIFGLIAIGLVIWATFSALCSVRRGESPLKAWKTWFSRVMDALSGIG